MTISNRKRTYRSVDATTRDFEPSQGNITFARLVLAATSKDALPESTQAMLPSRQVANATVQYFMANIYSLFPCFSETALLTILDDVYHQDGRVIKDSDYWLLYLVLAIGSTAQSCNARDKNYNNGVEHVCKALSYADGALGPGYVTQIQSLLLLTLYSMLDPVHFDTWHLIGFTSRAVVDLGLHQDPPTSSASDRLALDMRRKIFYCTYALDRLVVPLPLYSWPRTYFEISTISMAHARSFSFADESINVEFPQSSDLGDKKATPGPISGPQSADPALLLCQLRRAQSYWYQVLYQSEPTPLPNPTGFLWQMCLEMREWQQSLPDTLPPGIRQMFEQELRYSYVYCIAPSARGPQITDYIRILIFEYSLEYLNNMYDIAYGGLNSAFYTYHDALKVYFMASQFLAVLRDAQDLLLSGQHVPPPAVPPGSPPPPPIPRRIVRPGIPVESNLDRTIWCLERISKTLELYGVRWEDALMLKRSFEQLSSETVDRLRGLRQMPGHNPYQNSVQSISPPGAVQVQGQQAPAGMRWIGMDAAQMMHGGPRG